MPLYIDPACDGSGATGPPAATCTPGTGRLAVLLGTTSGFFIDCDAVAESEETWAARRAGTDPQLLAEDIEIISVPEPSPALLQVMSVLAVVALARRSGWAPEKA